MVTDLKGKVSAAHTGCSLNGQKAKVRVGEEDDAVMFTAFFIKVATLELHDFRGCMPILAHYSLPL